MFEGFVRHVLPSRASFMFDFVAVAMVLVVPALTYSIYLVRVRKDYLTHKRLQLGLGAVLLLAVILFEVDIRFHDWKHLTTSSPYHGTILFPFLYFHVLLASSTTLLWIWTIAGALRKIPNPPGPSSYSPFHRRLARLAAIGMYLTAVTGWTFYYMAFIAS